MVVEKRTCTGVPATHRRLPVQRVAGFRASHKLAHDITVLWARDCLLTKTLPEPIYCHPDCKMRAVVIRLRASTLKQHSWVFGNRKNHCPACRLHQFARWPGQGQGCRRRGRSHAHCRPGIRASLDVIPGFPARTRRHAAHQHRRHCYRHRPQHHCQQAPYGIVDSDRGIGR
jgi:hypothetical protein